MRMYFGQLCRASKGQIVGLAAHHNTGLFRVVEVRDLAQRPLLPKSVEVRPELIRSRYSVRLQSVRSGRIQTIYRAENVACYSGLHSQATVSF